MHVAARSRKMSSASYFVPAAGAVAEQTAYVGDAELKGVPGLWSVHIATCP